jgi:hypothetical protein
MNRFSNRQVAAMVIALCIAIVLTPVSVMAATGQLVNITDPVKKSSSARVDGGKLRVGDGSGPMTVDGTVAAPMSLPNRPFHARSGVNADFQTGVAVQRRGRNRLAITSVIATSSINADAGTRTRVQLRSFVINSPTWDCNVSSGVLPEGSVEGINITLMVGINDTVNVTFPSPLVLFGPSKAGTTSCLWVTDTGIGGPTRHTEVEFVGFWAG